MLDDTIHTAKNVMSGHLFTSCEGEYLIKRSGDRELIIVQLNGLARF